MPKPVKMHMLFSILAVLLGMAFTVRLISLNQFKPNTAATLNANVDEIGLQMLNTINYGFVLPFEAVSILLLAATIGCIVIALKLKTPEKK
jgi:NADH-quinone oxidoreductase subunit J